MLPTKRIGTFSLFGLSGLSGGSLKDVKADKIAIPGNQTIASDISEDYPGKIGYVTQFALFPNLMYRLYF